jgi:hypothetical protein
MSHSKVFFIPVYVFASVLILAFILTGCGQSAATQAYPEKGPDVVTKQFYEYISESKIKGGPSYASKAYKMIDTEASNLELYQFLEIIKKYPPGFMVDVGETEINGAQALVMISYKMPSSFGDGYTVKGTLPLNIDRKTNTWRIDFTGDSYGMDKEAAKASMQETTMASMQETTQPGTP